MAQDQQKPYTDLRHEIEFKVDNLVFVKVSPLEGNINFGKKGKFGPRYIGSFLKFKWFDDCSL